MRAQSGNEIDSCICLTPEEFQGSEILQAKYESLVIDTTVLRQLNSKLEDDKRDLIYDMTDYKRLYDITEKQYRECLSVPRETGFNLLEVTGIALGTGIITAIITLIVK